MCFRAKLGVVGAESIVKWIAGTSRIRKDIYLFNGIVWPVDVEIEPDIEEMLVIGGIKERGDHCAVG